MLRVGPFQARYRSALWGCGLKEPPLPGTLRGCFALSGSRQGPKGATPPSPGHCGECSRVIVLRAVCLPATPLVAATGLR